MARLRVAQTFDQSRLRTLLEAARAGGARLEMVCKNRSRWAVALCLDRSALRSLIEMTRPGSNARLELVFPETRKRVE